MTIIKNEFRTPPKCDGAAIIFPNDAFDLRADLQVEADRACGVILPDSIGRRYEPATQGEAGLFALIAPLYETDGTLVDLVAWSPDNPNNWWLRRGEFSVADARSLFMAECTISESALLCRTPQSWRSAIAAGEHALVVLDWAVDLRFQFGTLRNLDYECPELAERLEQNWRDHARPNIRLSQAAEARFDRHAA